MVGLGHEVYKISLKHLVVPEYKDVLKKNTNNNQHKGGCMSKVHKNQWEELPMDKSGQFEKGNKVVLDYNPTYKIDIDTDVNKGYNK